MSLPGVSMICPTYGRYPDFGHLLEERVESFLWQDYLGSRELLVLNDTPEQTLRLEYSAGGRSGPGYSASWHVRIINTARRLPSLGEKYNAAIWAARYDLLMPAEDDDVHLPHAITQAVEMLGTADVWKPNQVFFRQGSGPVHWRHNVGIRHHASIYKRSAWEKVGGYDPVSGPQDALFDAKLRQQCVVAPEGLPHPKDWQYLYRFGVGVHLSGFHDPEAAYREIGTQPVTPGTFTIRPHWREDYVALCRAALPV